VDVVQCRGVGSAGADAAVGLLAAAVGDAGADEGAHELALVGGVAGEAHDVCVRVRGDGVGVADEADFVGVFCHAAAFDGGFEGVEIGFGEGGEGDVGGDLWADGVDDIVVSDFRGEEVVYLVGRVAGVDVVSGSRSGVELCHVYM